ncbi:ICOS ligand-like [Mugil cephalus]|uniref:ICOS ligand-like n=1 Tax=Mugil cephalus TaxID=48193 RepID=UPI001FB71879|nr:ICOS ligand-like [Mugil cephalus]XP_047443993.1 ICOS ligand-like [Mugil cephalus]
MCPQRTVPLALWRTGLLLGFLTLCASLEEGCVLGVVGRPVSLSCFYPESGLLPFGNFSIEWKRDEEVVLRSVWEEGRSVDTWSINNASLSVKGGLPGNFSLELPAVDPREDPVFYNLSISEGNHSVQVCSVCVRIAASFSHPQVQKEAAVQGNEKVFLCQASGGYPLPEVYWLINESDQPPEGSVRTVTSSLPNSVLYNITSHLTVNISKDSTVLCVIENQSLNETFTSKSIIVPGGPPVRRASEAMWIFSTGLCVVVGIMVIAGVVYQINLDRISKRRKKEHQQQERGYRRRYQFMEETETMTTQAKETDV